jgi:hypothetical protein
MIGWVIKIVAGLVLFAGSLVGGLFATGRLNHEGTANIPLLKSFFPPPPPLTEGLPPAGEHGAAPDAKNESAEHGDGAAIDAHASPAGSGKGAPQDAVHAEGTQDPKVLATPRKQKVGRSLSDAEKPAGDGHGGGDDGHGAKADAHGDEGKAGHDAKDAGAHAAPAGETHGKADAHHGSAPESDFAHLQQSLTNARSQYSPGKYFRFEGMPAGMTPEQINEAWQRVQGQLADIEKRRIALELREQALEERESDISRRQAALGKERVELEQMQRQLDLKIQRFQDQVKMVRADEAAALKRNAQTLSAFEPAKAAEILTDLWQKEKGQDEVLKLLEFMEKDAVNEILQLLPTPTTQEILKKRLRVSKEASPPAKGN